MPRIANSILKEKSKVGGLMLLDFDLLYSYSNHDNVISERKDQ